MSAESMLAGLRVVPVVVVEDAASAVELAETLLAAGLPAIEVTLRVLALAIAALVARRRAGLGFSRDLYDPQIAAVRVKSLARLSRRVGPRGAAG